MNGFSFLIPRSFEQSLSSVCFNRCFRFSSDRFANFASNAWLFIECTVINLFVFSKSCRYSDVLNETHRNMIECIKNCPKPNTDYVLHEMHTVLYLSRISISECQSKQKPIPLFHWTNKVQMEVCKCIAHFPPMSFIRSVHGFDEKRIDENKYSHMWIIMRISLVFVLNNVPWHGMLVLCVSKCVCKWTMRECKASIFRRDNEPLECFPSVKFA